MPAPPLKEGRTDANGWKCAVSPAGMCTWHPLGRSSIGTFVWSLLGAAVMGSCPAT
mgnify:FL=1